MSNEELVRQAGERLHHLSMLYGGAICELAQGKPLGMIPRGYPGLSKMRDLADIILLVRAELNGLTALLLKAGVLKSEDVLKTFADEYDWLTQQKAKQFGVEVTDSGLTYKVGGDQ